MTTKIKEKPIESMDEFYARYLPRERLQVLHGLAEGGMLEVSVKLKWNWPQHPTHVPLALLNALRLAGLIEPIPSLDRNVFGSGDVYRITERGRKALNEAESAQMPPDSFKKVGCRHCGKIIQK